MTRETVKRIPLIGDIATHGTRFVRRFRARTKLNLVDTFPMFAPNSQGRYKSISPIVIDSVNSVLPLIGDLADSFCRGAAPRPELITDFPRSEVEIVAAEALKIHLDEQGSDKASWHNYHFVYGSILANSHDIRAILEVGLGTNNADVVSTMGSGGIPGASVRAFRNFLPKAIIYGADIDRRILFSEDRIDTFYVDQCDWKSFKSLGESIPKGLDLVIDDGLHSPHANLATLRFGLGHIRLGGWVVIEDIAHAHLPIWRVVASLLPADQFEPHLVSANRCFMFAVKRVG